MYKRNDVLARDDAARKDGKHVRNDIFPSMGCHTVPARDDVAVKDVQENDVLAKNDVSAWDDV